MLGLSFVPVTGKLQISARQFLIFPYWTFERCNLYVRNTMILRWGLRPSLSGRWLFLSISVVFVYGLWGQNLADRTWVSPVFYLDMLSYPVLAFQILNFYLFLVLGYSRTYIELECDLWNEVWPFFFLYFLVPVWKWVLDVVLLKLLASRFSDHESYGNGVDFALEIRLVFILQNLFHVFSGLQVFGRDQAVSLFVAFEEHCITNDECLSTLLLHFHESRLQISSRVESWNRSIFPDDCSKSFGECGPSEFPAEDDSTALLGEIVCGSPNPCGYICELRLWCRLFQYLWEVILWLTLHLQSLQTRPSYCQA